MPGWEPDQLTNVSAEVRNLRSDVTRIERELQSFRELCSDSYILQAEFKPVKLIVYGLVSVILMSVMGGLVALLIHK